MDAETREVMTVGKVELNMRPMRTKVYVLQDELNQLTNKVMELPKEYEDYRNDLLDNIKDIKRLINAL